MPELQMAGAGALAGGLGSGLDRISNAIERIQERKKEEEDERKRVVTAAKASASLLKALSDDERAQLGLPDPSTFAMLDPQSQVGTVTGAMQAFGAKRAISDMREGLAKDLAQADAVRRRQAFNADAMRQLQAIGQPGRPALEAFYEQGDDESQRPRRQAPPGVLVLEAAARAGALDPARLDPDALLRNLGQQEEQSFFKPDQFGKAFPVTGPDGKPITGTYTTPLGPKVSQVITDPSAGLVTQEITDANGVKHTVLVPARGQPQFMPRTQGQITDRDRYTAINREIQALLPFAAIGTNAQVIAELKAEREALERGGPPPARAGSASGGPVEWYFDAKDRKLKPRP